MSPFEQENLNEDLKERIEELTVSVNLQYKKINHDFLQQNQKKYEYLVMYEVSGFLHKCLLKLRNFKLQFLISVCRKACRKFR